MNFKCVIDNFFNKYDRYEIHKLSFGNVNKTYQLIIYKNSKAQKWVLQNVSSVAFDNPSLVINNGFAVIDCLNCDALYYLKTISGDNYFIDSEQNYWRVFNWVENSVAFDFIINNYLASQCGLCFGNLLCKLQVIDQTKLYIPQKTFHNLKTAYNLFEDACSLNFMRFKRIERECKIIFALKNSACLLQSLLEQKKLPLRLIHNDTKCSNVLFDKNTLNFITPIDFDTVMNGAIAYDFGDGARSVCSSVKEDEQNFNLVNFDLEKFYYFSKSFLSKLKSILTNEEKQTLYLGVLTITTELALRFFIDYLSWDKYFKVDYEEHNKIRAINQLILALDVLDKNDKIAKIVDECLK